MHREGLSGIAYILLAGATLLAVLLCAALGSVAIPLPDTVRILFDAVAGRPCTDPNGIILLTVRLPRVLAVALTGAMLSVSGAAMQGLLRNPLADGTTLGVSSGASLGAVAAIAFGFTLPGVSGTAVAAMLCSFLSLLLILSVARRIDGGLSTNTVILLGVIFSMFCNSMTSLLVTFFSSKVRHITFWTMGSLSGSTYRDVLLLFGALVLFSAVLLSKARELNAFSVGEDNARSVGIDVKRTKLTVLVAASALIGVSVSVGGTIGFVGLVIPHMTRLVTGPNHKKLLPACLFSGAIFLLLADLAARTLLAPRELPIGVVTSLVGAVAFLVIFFRARRAGKC